MSQTSIASHPRARTTFSIDRRGPIDPPVDTCEPRIRRALLCPTLHLAVDDLIRLFALIEREGGVATLDEICQALPTVHRPVSGVLDLCDAGILECDFTAPFDGHTRIWRRAR